MDEKLKFYLPRIRLWEKSLYDYSFDYRYVFFISGEIISNLRDLQSLAIDLKAEKEKQKSEVKHILQQKQRALSDLFKMLAEIGESLKRTVYPK